MWGGGTQILSIDSDSNSDSDSDIAANLLEAIVKRWIERLDSVLLYVSAG